MKRLLAASLLIALSPAAFADNTSAGHLDLYYIPMADLDVSGPGGGSDDGDGFGIRGIGVVAPQFAITGEYQTVSYDESSIDNDQFRIGAGFLVEGSSGLFAEYIDYSVEGPGFDNSADGFGIHGKLAGDISPGVGLWATVGYLMLGGDFEDASGLEWSVGGAFNLTPQFGLFADYRMTNLEGEDSGVEVEYADLRVGGRFNF